MRAHHDHICSFHLGESDDGIRWLAAYQPMLVAYGLVRRNHVAKHATELVMIGLQQAVVQFATAIGGGRLLDMVDQELGSHVASQRRCVRERRIAGVRKVRWEDNFSLAWQSLLLQRSGRQTRSDARQFEFSESETQLPRQLIGPVQKADE
jgi:hypothetical protein